MEWKAGQRFLGLYTIRGLLGEGAMGRVFRVHHRGWDVELAVKVPRAEILGQPGGAARFEAEAETWVRLGLHPHTASCHYVRRVEGTPAVFAEYVAGGSLADWVARGWLYRGGREAAQRRVLDVAIQCAWGLAYAHRQGLIHQDVKPANLLVDRDGTAKVTDFGLARAAAFLPAAPSEPLSAAGGPEGTLVASCRGLTRLYASPEQLALRPVSRRSDLWSWAVSVLQLYWGRVAWSAGDQAPAALDALCGGEEVAPAIPPLPPALAELLRACLQRDPEKRPAGMQAVADTLVPLFEALCGRPYERRQPVAGLQTPEGLNNRAVSLMDLGQPAEAEALWEKALALRPHHAEATYNLARARWRSGAWDGGQVRRALQEMRASHLRGWRDEALSAMLHLELDDDETAAGLLAEGAGGGSPPLRLPRLVHSRRGVLARVQAVEGCAISALAVLPGNRRMLIADVAGRVGCLSIRRRCVDPLGAHGCAVSALAWAAAGPLFFSADVGGGLRCWSRSGWRLCWERHPVGTAIHALACSADGGRVIVGGADGRLVLRDARAGEVLSTIEAHAGPVTALDLDPAGALAASGGADGQLRLWRLSDGAMLAAKDLTPFFRARAGHAPVPATRASAMPPAPRAVRFLPGDAGAILAGGACGLLLRWDLARNRTWALNREPRVFDTFLWLCPAPDRSYLLTGGEDGVPGVWKTGSGRRVARLLPPGGEPTSALSLSPDGRLAASGDRRGAVTLWRAACRRGYAAPQALCRVVSSRQALSIALQVDAVLARVQRLMNRGDFAAAAQCLGPLRQAGGHDRSPEAQRLWGTLYRHLARTTLERAWERAVVGRQPVAAISADGRWLALGGRAVMREDGLLHLVALEDDARRSLVLHRGFVGALAFSPCSRFLLSGGHDCTLALWDVARGALLATFNGHRNHVTAIRFGGDGRSVLSASGSLGRQGAVAEMILWDFPSGRPRHVLHGHGGKITAVDLSADGATALSGSVDGSARLWDLALGKPLRRIAFGAEVLGVCLDRQARSLLLCGRRPEIWIAAPDSGELLGRLEGHQEAVNSVILTPGGRHAITGGGSDAGDTTVRFWELASGSCLRVFSGHTAAVTGLCLSGDARLLVSASGGARPETRLWELDWRLGPPAAVA